MNRGYAAAVLAIAATMSLHGEAQAGRYDGAPPLPSLSCFYECKPGPLVDDTPTLRELTTLMIGSSAGGEGGPYATTSGASMGPGGPIRAYVRIFDGNAQLRAATSTSLIENDLDELNVCATIRNAPYLNGAATTQGANGSPIPEAGLIRIDLNREFDPRQATTSGSNECIGPFGPPCDGQFPGCCPGLDCVGEEGDSECVPDNGGPPGPPPPPPVHVWVKNLVGRFFVQRDEPFEGRVIGIGKTQCMVGPPSERWDRGDFDDEFGPLVVAPVLVEDTEDDERGGPIGPCGDEPLYPECDGICPPGYACRPDDPPATTSGSRGGECLCFPSEPPGYPCGGDPDFPICDGSCDPGDECRPVGGLATTSGFPGALCRCLPD